MSRLGAATRRYDFGRLALPWEPERGATLPWPAGRGLRRDTAQGSLVATAAQVRHSPHAPSGEQLLWSSEARAGAVVFVCRVAPACATPSDDEMDKRHDRQGPRSISCALKGRHAAYTLSDTQFSSGSKADVFFAVAQRSHGGDVVVKVPRANETGSLSGVHCTVLEPGARTVFLLGDHARPRPHPCARRGRPSGLGNKPFLRQCGRRQQLAEFREVQGMWRRR